MTEHAVINDQDYESRASIKDIEEYLESPVWADTKDMLEGKLVKLRDMLEVCESGKVPKVAVNVNLSDKDGPKRALTLEELQAEIRSTRQFLMYPEIMMYDLTARASNRKIEEQEHGGQTG